MTFETINKHKKTYIYKFGRFSKYLFINYKDFEELCKLPEAEKYIQMNPDNTYTCMGLTVIIHGTEGFILVAGSYEVKDGM